MPRGRRSAHDSTAGALKAAQSLAAVVDCGTPVGFELDAEETAVFRSYSQNRESWTPAEAHMLARLAQHELFIRRQTAIIAQEGDLTVNASGSPIPNPRWSLIHASERSHLQLLGKLHLGGTSKDRQVANTGSLGKRPLKPAAAPPPGTVDWSKVAAAECGAPKPRRKKKGGA